jgi:hypothetical protein
MSEAVPRRAAVQGIHEGVSEGSLHRRRPDPQPTTYGVRAQTGCRVSWIPGVELIKKETPRRVARGLFRKGYEFQCGGADDSMRGP